MNSSRLETPKKEPEKKKNIREIYLQALKHSKGFKKQQSTKRGISNLTSDQSATAFSGSNFLEKEYNLVQRIISDTKELKSIKVKNDTNSHQLNQMVPNKYKSQEEYYQEVLELKRTIKALKNSEFITKAKFEYYEGEMTKKESEILDLLDAKKSDVISIAESKSDLSALCYTLKQKAYKLEFALKRKDAELSKLKNELKTTNLKETQIQNERLRAELASALTHDKRIIQVFNQKGEHVNTDGSSYYDSEMHKNLSEVSLSKREILKQNIAKQLQGDIYSDSNDFISKFRNHSTKIILKGTLLEKLAQLDQRETDLLEEIEKLNEELLELKNTKPSSSRLDKRTPSLNGSGSDRSRDTRSNSQNENIKTLQSIMRGHLYRVKNLNRSPTPSPERRRSPPVRQVSPPIRRSPPRRHENHRQRHDHHNEDDNDDDNEEQLNNQRKRNERRKHRNRRDSDEKVLISEDHRPEVVDTGSCCSGSKSSKKDK